MWRPTTLTTNIDTRLSGTRFENIFQDFVTNSAIFPLACIILEFVFPHWPFELVILHSFILLMGALVQAAVLGSRMYHGRPMLFLANLIGPIICLSTCIVIFFGNFKTFCHHHFDLMVLYFAYSFCVGFFQECRVRMHCEYGKHSLILAENIIRSGTLLALFWVAQSTHDHSTHSIWAYVKEPHHVFMVILILVYGLMIGMWQINEFRYSSVLRKTAGDLRKYSEWFLGAELLRRTVQNPEALSLHKAERTVLFMDIRGFTKWSSANTPEDAVGLVNDFFITSEEILIQARAIKMELTGDEIMAVFQKPDTAVRTAEFIFHAVRKRLLREGLDIGIGINTGPLIEGIVGGRKVKKYSVMGDTVNVGKRICDVAERGEILLSERTQALLGKRIVIKPMQKVHVKGKTGALNLYPLESANPAELPSKQDVRPLGKTPVETLEIGLT